MIFDINEDFKCKINNGEENRIADDLFSNHFMTKFMNFKTVATLSNKQLPNYVLDDDNIITERLNNDILLSKYTNEQIENKNNSVNIGVNSFDELNQRRIDTFHTFKEEAFIDDPFKFLEIKPDKHHVTSDLSESNYSNTSMNKEVKKTSIFKTPNKNNLNNEESESNETKQEISSSSLKPSKISFRLTTDSSQDSKKSLGISKISKEVHPSSSGCNSIDQFPYLLDPKLKAQYELLSISYNDNHKMIKHFIRQMLPQIPQNYKKIFHDRDCKIYQGEILLKFGQQDSNNDEIEDIKHGFGIYYTFDELYIGLFENNLRTNKGVCFYLKTNECYIGNWENDKRSGLGSLYYSKSNPKYIGHWYNDKKQGKGIWIYEDGKMYEGEFNDDIIEGNGILRYSNGFPYLTGQWKNNKKEGKFFVHVRDGKGQLMKYYENDIEVIANVNTSPTKNHLLSKDVRLFYNSIYNEETKDTISASNENSIRKSKYHLRQTSEQISTQKAKNKLKSNDKKISCFEVQDSGTTKSRDKMDENWVNNQNINYFMAYLQQMNENEYWDCQHKTQFKYKRIYTLPDYFFTEFLKNPISSTHSSANKYNKINRNDEKQIDYTCSSNKNNKKNTLNMKDNKKLKDIEMDFFYSNVSYHTIKFICNANLIVDNYERILIPYHNDNNQWSLCEINCSNPQNFVFILYDPNRNNSIELSGTNEKPLLILYNWLRSEIESRCYENYFDENYSIEKYRKKLNNSEFKVFTLPMRYKQRNAKKSEHQSTKYDQGYRNNKINEHSIASEENDQNNYDRIVDSGIVICQIAQCIYEQIEIDFEKEDIENIKDLMKRLYLHDLNSRI